MGSKINNLKVIWFDESINKKENQDYLKELRSNFNIFDGYNSLEQGFDNFYQGKRDNEFTIIITIVSGRLFGRFIRKLKANINKIVNIPYIYIFTSIHFKKLLLNEISDKNNIMSYDTKKSVNHDFYNPGGVYDDFDNLLIAIKSISKQIDSNIIIKPRINEKINYEGVLTFEYLESEEDLLAPALYKDIIIIEEITKEDCKNFHEYILSLNDTELTKLIKYLYLFKFIPFEILSKYWVRCYTIESSFYKILNNNLMKSKLPSNFKTFIKMLYTGVEINSLQSYPRKYLYRGARINKVEMEKIKKYKNFGKLSTVVVFSKAFLSFSENKEKAIKFCKNSDNNNIGILYTLENDNANSHKSNAQIQNFSVFPEEKEILFFPGSSFIIKDIKEINDNKIEIILNYNGKFKEKYSFIYNDQKKLNNMVYNNVLTKNISGKELQFLKGGKYLILDKINYQALKGKDLETDEIVTIKQIRKENYLHDLGKEELAEIKKKAVYNEFEIGKKISEKTKYSVKYKDVFETDNYYYIVMDYYDTNLDIVYKNYLKIHRKGFPPNLIKKIFTQLNLALKELLNYNIIHGNINPENILIKINEDKTNFDSIITNYDYSEEYNENQSKKLKLGGTLYFIAPEVWKKNKDTCKRDLYGIGVTIYYLYFGKYPISEVTVDPISRNLSFKKDLMKIKDEAQLDDLVAKLLKENPDERITWKEYFEHQFFKQYEY